MGKYSIDIDLKDDVKLEFDNIISKAHSAIKNKVSENEILLGFFVADHTVGTKLVFNKDDMGTVKTFPIEGFTWEALEQEVPEISNFYEKYPLEKTFALMTDKEIPPHRHRHNLTSCWTMTFINSDREGHLKFYEDPNTFSEDQKITWDKGSWNCIDEMSTKPNGVYAFDTWNWHSWYTDCPNPIIANFCIKGSSEKETTKNIIDENFSKD